MKIYVVGNLLVNQDNIPLKILPRLKHAFPKITFMEIDPTEEFIPEKGSIIFDTVVGINKVTVFDNIDDFEKSPLISPHDYDLRMHIKLLMKLGKISNVVIIGVPQNLEMKQITNQLIIILKSFVKM